MCPGVSGVSVCVSCPKTADELRSTQCGHRGVYRLRLTLAKATPGDDVASSRSLSTP